MKKKTILKRISALLCALMVCVGVFGGAVPYKAETKAEKINGILESIGLRSLSNIDESYDYMLVRLGNNVILRGAKEQEVPYNWPICAFIFDDGTWGLSIGFGTCDWFVNSGEHIDGYYYSAFWWNGYSVNTLEYTGVRGHSFDSFDDLPNYVLSDMSDIEVLYSDVDILYCTRLCPDGETGYFYKTGTALSNYNKEIGYLQNLKHKRRALTDNSGTTNMSSMKNIFTFDTVTTTGINMSEGDYVVRVYGQMAFHKNGTHEIVNEDFPIVEFDEFDASNGYLEYTLQSIFDVVSESAESPYNVFDNAIKQIIRCDNVYLQIVDRSTGEYGGYTKLYTKKVGDAEEIVATTVTPELEIDDGGYIDIDPPSSTGQGTTWDDAELNDKPTGTSNTDFADFESSLNSLVSGLASVPKAFGVMFSFLPSWCLNLLAISVGALPMILLFKVFRG